MGPEYVYGGGDRECGGGATESIEVEYIVNLVVVVVVNLVF